VLSHEVFGSSSLIVRVKDDRPAAAAGRAWKAN
jgi:hypothetical protein